MITQPTVTGSLLTIPIVDRLVSDYIVKHDHTTDSDWQFINNSNSRSSSVGLYRSLLTIPVVDRLVSDYIVKHSHTTDSDWQFINNSNSR